MDLFLLSKRLRDELQPRYVSGEATEVARLLVEDVYGRVPLYEGQYLSRSRAAKARLRRRLARIQAGEPLQYVLGYAYFLGRRLRVSPRVLIPRPETEEMTSRVIDLIKRMSAPPRVLDIGTGSGCVAVSLALVGAEVDALDCSLYALRCTMSNAHHYGVKVRCLRRDFLSTPTLDSNYDILVSNPPYIPEDEHAQLEEQVKNWEPRAALLVPSTRPLIFYEAIADQGRRLLKPGGWLFVEFHSRYATQVCDLFEASAYDSLCLCRDLSGRLRWLEARRS